MIELDKEDATLLLSLVVDRLDVKESAYGVHLATYLGGEEPREARSRLANGLNLSADIMELRRVRYQLEDQLRRKS